MKQINLLLCLFSTIVAYGQAPVISDFNPKIAPPGTTVTLTGTGFNTTTVNNVVHFGSIRTNVTSATATELLVEVPEGAVAEKFTVLNTTTNLLGQTSF